VTRDWRGFSRDKIEGKQVWVIPAVFGVRGAGFGKSGKRTRYFDVIKSGIVCGCCSMTIFTKPVSSPFSNSA